MRGAIEGAVSMRSLFHEGDEAWMKKVQASV